METIFIGKDRQYNRRFLQMCSHHLVEPVACTPASGWEKGQVENQVGLVRERFFTPRLRVKSYDELNAWLMDKCIAWAKAHPHPEQPDRTIWKVFEEERSKLVPYRGRFDGFHALPASVSKTFVIRQDGRIVAEHPRCYGRGETIYDPWHYVPVLARKPGALRNGAPFKDWVLPTALDRVRRKLAGSADGDRQMVKILAAVLTDGLLAVEAACLQALSEGVARRRRSSESACRGVSSSSMTRNRCRVANSAESSGCSGRPPPRTGLAGRHRLSRRSALGRRAPNVRGTTRPAA